MSIEHCCSVLQRERTRFNGHSLRFAFVRMNRNKHSITNHYDESLDSYKSLLPTDKVAYYLVDFGKYCSSNRVGELWTTESGAIDDCSILHIECLIDTLSIDIDYMK